MWFPACLGDQDYGQRAAVSKKKELQFLSFQDSVSRIKEVGK